MSVEHLSEIDYSSIGKSRAIRIFANMAPAARNSLRRQRCYERECLCQDMAEQEAIKIRRKMPYFFGTHVIGFRATRGYGLFEEAFMATLTRLLFEERQRELAARRRELNRRRSACNSEKRRLAHAG